MGYKLSTSDRVLITGGGGYLGAKLAERLVKSGCELFLTDIRFNEISKALGERHKNIHLKTLDLRRKLDVSDVCRNISPDVIFHFASLIDRSRDFAIYESLYDVNVQGTLNLLEGLRSVQYKDLYFSSTSEVYGNWLGEPFREDIVLHPASPYSLTKVFCENTVGLFSEINDKSYKIFRIFNYCGKDMPDTTFIGQMLDAYKRGLLFEMTEGEQTRDILFIDDLLDQILFVTEADSNFRIFNICSGQSFKMRDVAREFKIITQNTFRYACCLPYRKNEVWVTRGDNSRLQGLGFKYSNLSLSSMLNSCIC